MDIIIGTLSGITVISTTGAYKAKVDPSGEASERFYAPSMAPNEPQLHREGGPAIIEYDAQGNVVYEEWWLKGEHHRENGPAYICYGGQNNVLEEGWCQNGDRHRIDGPAVVEYDMQGDVLHEEWWQNNVRQRVDGPAIVRYDS